MRKTKMFQVLCAFLAICGGLASADEQEGKKRQRGSKPPAGERVQRPEGNPAALLEQAFSRLDANGDGRIDQDEFLAPILQRFQRADSNGDGSIDRDEMSAAREQIAGMMRGGPWMMPGNRPAELGEARPLDSNPGEKRPPEDRIRELMQRIQLDESGSILLADVPEPMRTRLTRLDANSDGLVDSSEGGELLTRIQKARMQRDQKSKDGTDSGDEEKGRRGNDRKGPQKPKRPSDENRD